MQCIVFSTNSARILTNPTNGRELSSWPNVVFDPDLSRVEGVMPQFWKIQDGEIYPMNSREIKYRKKVIQRHGIDNFIRRLEEYEIRPELKDMQIIEALDNEYTAIKRNSLAILIAQVLIFALILYLVVRR